MVTEPRYIDEKEVARITSIGIQTLRNKRHQGKGLAYYKLGRSVRYRFEDVVNFVESHKIQTLDTRAVEDRG